MLKQQPQPQPQQQIQKPELEKLWFPLRNLHKTAAAPRGRHWPPVAAREHQGGLGPPGSTRGHQGPSGSTSARPGSQKGAARGCQGPPGSAKGRHEPSGAARRRQRPLGASRARGHKEPQGAARSRLESPGGTKYTLTSARLKQWLGSKCIEIKSATACFRVGFGNEHVSCVHVRKVLRWGNTNLILSLVCNVF